MTRRTLLWAPLLALLLGLWGGVSWAQKKPDGEGWMKEDLPPEMKAARESVPAGSLVAGAYGFIWAAVLLYVGTVAARTRRLEADLATLERRLSDGEARSAAANGRLGT